VIGDQPNVNANASTSASRNSIANARSPIGPGCRIYYPGLPHGLTATHADLVNRDLLAFCQQGQRKVA
jgi:hypothetical protein